MKYLVLAMFILVGGIGAFADFIGIGNPHTFGVSQYLAIAISAIGSIVTYLQLFLGRTSKQVAQEMGSLYVTVAINVMNIFLLLVIVELGFTIALKIYLRRQSQSINHEPLSSPLYAKYPWIGDFREEYSKSQNFRYRPYFVWERMPAKGKTVNILEDGTRLTVGSNCEGKKKIFLFGGSTVWGVGSPDWSSIPSELQKLLVKAGKNNYCVVNFGENAFVVTQNLLRLIQQIQIGSKPEIVVFYNGFNEVTAAFQTKRAGLHQNYSEIEEKLGNGTNIRLKKELKFTEIFQHFMPNTFSYLFIYGREKSYGDVRFSDNLSRDIAEDFMKNIEIVKALGLRFGFDSYFFLQPSIFQKNRLTEFEKSGRNVVTENFISLLNDSYKLLRKGFKENQNRLSTYDISDTFLDLSEDVFVDRVHISPDGNKRIAKEIFSKIKLK